MWPPALKGNESMATLKSLIIKETLHIVRDRRTMLIVLVMPVILLLLFGFAISMEVNSVRVAAVVTRHDDYTRQRLMRLQTNPYFDFRGILPHTEIDNALRRGEADIVVVMRADYGNHENQIIVDASNTAVAQSATAYVENVLAANAGKAPMIVRTFYNPQLKSAYNFVPGILGMIFILICAIMTSVSIVSEKESGTMSLLLVSPIRAGTVILGKLIPYFLLSCILLGLMLLISYTLLEIPFAGNLLPIVCVSWLYIILALAIGLLISTIVSTQMAALVVSAMMFMIPVIMLSGMIFPVDNMPQVLQWLSCAVPARWYIAAMRKLMIQQLPPDYLVTEISVLAGMTVFMLALAVRRFTISTR